MMIQFPLVLFLFILYFFLIDIRWDKTRFTRLSDILRLCIAYRYQFSYLDSDVHFLQLQKGWYQIAYVGAQLWSDNKNAIEITNAAFCLPRNILKDMMRYQYNLIMKKKEGRNIKYFYTELGPSMFHHVSTYVLLTCTYNWSFFSENCILI